MRAFYGFTRPYDFRKILPALAGILLCLLVLSAAAASAAYGRLAWDTPRSQYFLYLVGLSLGGAALSFAPRLAWLVLGLCFIELLLGAGSSVLVGMRMLPTTFLPGVEQRKGIGQFQYHPLLQVVPTPGFSRTVPFAIRHDSNGIRGPERGESELAGKIVVAAVGGSTTYDIAVPNGQTWPDVLEQQLGGEYAVINYGVPGHTTVENLLQTLFYIRPRGARLRCAIYYVGWNDIRNAHVPGLDPAYADFHLRTQVDNFQVRRAPVLAFSPLAQLTINALQRRFDTVPPAKDLRGIPPRSGSDERLESIFRANLNAIAAINKDRQITSIFIGQVLNPAQLRSDRPNPWLPLVRDRDAWPLQERFNAILQETGTAVGVPALLPPVEAFQDDDFVDEGHFSAKGSAKLARLVLPVVNASCR